MPLSPEMFQLSLEIAQTKDVIWACLVFIIIWIVINN